MVDDTTNTGLIAVILVDGSVCISTSEELRILKATVNEDLKTTQWVNKQEIRVDICSAVFYDRVNIGFVQNMRLHYCV